ncbi:MAG TPA: hypothetical protein VHM92_03015 [Allosphingosinicella sp.]|nr:hypothetical protein [Allosphingosinicella sp.]
MAPLVFALLLLAAPAAPEADATVDMGPALTGADYLLIGKAARHPAMRGAKLACYKIFTFDKGDRRVVAFVENYSTIEVETARGTTIIYPEHDPSCRSITFEMSAKGRVLRVIRTRPDHP